MNKAITVALMVFTCHVAALEYDVSGKQYDMTGTVKASIVAHCGPLAIRGPKLIDTTESFSIVFDAPGTAGSAFHIFNDSLLDAGSVVDGTILTRIRNRLYLQYAGVGSPLENGEKLKNFIIEKAAERDITLSPETSVVSYSFKSLVKSDGLRMAEKVGVRVPDYPRSGCNSIIRVKRKFWSILQFDSSSI